jgi:hypothetical protein
MTTTALEQFDIEDLVASAVGVLEDGQVTFGELVFLGGKLAGKVSPLVRLSGKEKEQLVLKVVDLALEQILKEKKASLSAEDFSAFSEKIDTAKKFVRETLPAVLAVVVQASKGQLDFQTAAKTGYSVMQYLCACWGVQLPEEPKQVSLHLKEVAQPVVEKTVEKTVSLIVPTSEEKSESLVLRQETMPQLPHQPDEESTSAVLQSNKDIEERPQEEVKILEPIPENTSE